MCRMSNVYDLGATILNPFCVICKKKIHLKANNYHIIILSSFILTHDNCISQHIYIYGIYIYKYICIAHSATSSNHSSSIVVLVLVLTYLLLSFYPTLFTAFHIMLLSLYFLIITTLIVVTRILFFLVLIPFYSPHFTHPTLCVSMF